MTARTPPLFLLWRLKTKGKLRLLLRRSKTVGGAVSLGIGVLLLGLWIASIVFRSTLVERTGEPPSVEIVRVGLVAYLVFVAFSSLSFRGVYLPRPELERLLSGPISRASIIRYRMLGAMLMAVPFTVIIALFLGPRFASPWAAALALVFTIPAASVFGQALSLFGAKTNGLWDRIFGRVSPALLRVTGALGIIGLFSFLAFGPGVDSVKDSRRDRIVEQILRERRRTHDGIGLGGQGIGSTEVRADDVLGPNAGGGESTAGNPSVGSRLERFASSPVVRFATAPMTPWARAITSRTVSGALPWIGLIILLFILSFEAVARMPIDFRETSLRTSQDLEKKISRMRRGQGGAGAFGVSSSSGGWRIPWVAGRSPFGAVVWVRVAWLIRQARGTLLIALLVSVIGTVVGIRVFDEPGSGPATLAILGVVYLASGIRADFRADLDRMESLRAWPISNWKVFVATLLPGTLLTTFVISITLLVRGVALGQLGPGLWVTLAVLPFLSYVWIAVDNAVFLLFPVRFVPGQGSALQHTGRSFLLVLLRGLILVGALSVAAGGAFFIYTMTAGDDPAKHALAFGLAAGWVVMTGIFLLTGLTAFGAWTLQRFDVSKVPSSGS